MIKLIELFWRKIYSFHSDTRVTAQCHLLLSLSASRRRGNQIPRGLET